VRTRRGSRAPQADGWWRVGAAWLLSSLLSLGLHLGAASPWLAWSYLHRSALDLPGEEGDSDGPTGNAGGEVALGARAASPPPVQVSLYTAPLPAPAAPPADPSEGAAPTDAAPAAARASAAPAPQVVRGTTRAERIAAREALQAAQAEGAADGDSHSLDDPGASHAGTAGKKPRGNKKPCEPVEEIVQLAEHRWRVERSLVDYYATHLRELDRQAGVALHKNAAGEKDGARMFLPRCSVLRQAGIKNGDVIHSLNGRTVTSVGEAVATYLVLRNDDHIRVVLTRKTGERLTLHYRMKR
jgi:hypothetical protein